MQALNALPLVAPADAAQRSRNPACADVVKMASTAVQKRKVFIFRSSVERAEIRSSVETAEGYPAPLRPARAGCRSA
jgi:hypothetical protein